MRRKIGLRSQAVLAIRFGCAALLLAMPLLMPGAVRANALQQATIAQATRRAWHDYKSEMQGAGWMGMQGKISECFKQLGATPSQQHAAYCIALDHLTLLDTLNFLPKLRPPFFATDVVFARMDKAVSRTTPQKDRAEFERRLLVTMQETIPRLN